MSTDDILAKMIRGWSRQPGAQVTGTNQTGVSAALWTSGEATPVEVSSDPDSSQHIVCVQLNSFFVEMFVDHKLHYRHRHAAGSSSIVRAGEYPRAVFRGDWQILHMYVPTALVTAIAETENVTARPETIELICHKGTHDAAIERIGLQIIKEAREGLAFSKLRVDALGQDLVIHLLRARSNLTIDALSKCLGGLAPWQLNRVTDYLMAHLADDVALAELATIAGLSPHHFCRAFKQSTGLPPHAWLTARRMERAQEMIVAHPAMGLSDIALCVGYQSQAAFGAAFKRVTGATPSQWRRGR